MLRGIVKDLVLDLLEDDRFLSQIQRRGEAFADSNPKEQERFAERILAILIGYLTRHRERREELAAVILGEKTYALLRFFAEHDEHYRKVARLDMGKAPRRF